MYGTVPRLRPEEAVRCHIVSYPVSEAGGPSHASCRQVETGLGIPAAHPCRPRWDVGRQSDP